MKPPSNVIDLTIDAAKLSPCMSQRGVAIYVPMQNDGRVLKD